MTECAVCDEPTKEPIIVSTPGHDEPRYVCGPDHHIALVQGGYLPGFDGMLDRDVACAMCEFVGRQVTTVQYPGSSRLFHVCSMPCHYNLARGVRP